MLLILTTVVCVAERKPLKFEIGNLLDFLIVFHKRLAFSYACKEARLNFVHTNASLTPREVIACVKADFHWGTAPYSRLANRRDHCARLQLDHFVCGEKRMQTVHGRFSFKITKPSALVKHPTVTQVRRRRSLCKQVLQNAKPSSSKSIWGISQLPVYQQRSRQCEHKIGVKETDNVVFPSFFFHFFDHLLVQNERYLWKNNFFCAKGLIKTFSDQQSNF